MSRISCSLLELILLKLPLHKWNNYRYYPGNLLNSTSSVFEMEYINTRNDSDITSNFRYFQKNILLFTSVLTSILCSEHIQMRYDISTCKVKTKEISSGKVSACNITN